MFGKLLPTRLAATSSPAPQFQRGQHTQTASKRPSSVFKKFIHVKDVFHRTSSVKKDANSQGTSQRRQGVPAPSQVSQGLATLTYDDRSGFDRRPHLRSPVGPTRSPASLNLSLRLQTGWQSSTSSTAPHSTLSTRNSPLLGPPQSVAKTSVTSFVPTYSSFQSSTQPAAPRSVDVRGIHSTIRDNIPAQVVDESDSANLKKLDALSKQIFAVDKDCSQLEKQLHEECDKVDKAKVALKEARSHLDETDEKHAALQIDRRNMQLGRLVGDKWRPLGSEASQRYFAPSQPAAEQEKKKRGASLAASKSSRRAKVVIKSWDSRWEALMIPERYSVTEIGAESVQEDSRPESDGRQSAKSAAPIPSQWMTQSLLDGPGEKASHASTPQASVVAMSNNESGQQTTDQRVRDEHQVDTSDYNGLPSTLQSAHTPGSPIRAQQYNARTSKHA